jgi:hypothetical protein
MRWEDVIELLGLLISPLLRSHLLLETKVLSRPGANFLLALAR